MATPRAGVPPHGAAMPIRQQRQLAREFRSTFPRTRLLHAGNVVPAHRRTVKGSAGLGHPRWGHCSSGQPFRVLNKPIVPHADSADTLSSPYPGKNQQDLLAADLMLPLMVPDAHDVVPLLATGSTTMDIDRLDS